MFSDTLFLSFLRHYCSHTFAETSRASECRAELAPAMPSAAEIGCKQQISNRMAIDTKSVSQLIAEFRKLHAKDTITPESLGYILQRLADLLINSNFRFREVFPGRGRGNDRSEEQRNLGYFYCVPGGDSMSRPHFQKNASLRLRWNFHLSATR